MRRGSSSTRVTKRSDPLPVTSLFRNLHDYVALVDRHRVRLGDEGAFDQAGGGGVRVFDEDAAGLDGDRVAANPRVDRVVPGLAGFDVVFPAVPGAAKDFSGA